MGIGMILSGVLSKGGRKHPISGIYGGIIGGLFLAAILTQGFSFVYNITDQFTDITDSDYRATEEFTMNTAVTSDSLELNVDSVNGGVNVYSWSGDTIKWDVEVKAKGTTTSEAETRLDEFDYDLTNKRVSDIQELSFSFPLSNTQWSNYAVLIEVYVPSNLDSEYNIDTTNGEIGLHDLICNNVNLDTTNGAITLSNIEAAVIDAETTNGGIQGTITAQQSTMRTTNGAIEISLSQTSGIHDFRTTNGVIDISAPTGSDVGYKVDFDTSIGALDINLPDMDYNVDTTRTKIGETNDYSLKSIQIEITAETSIGGIEVN